ncbi:Uncharacterised protein [Bordetella bronchiseptica]|nr:Uncharacterised protein [Bordetella bronchiseptica]
MVELPVMCQVVSISVTCEVLPGSVMAAPVRSALRATTVAVAAMPAARVPCRMAGKAGASVWLGSRPGTVTSRRTARAPESATCSQLVAPSTAVPSSSTRAVPPSMPMALPRRLRRLPPLTVAVCASRSLDISKAMAPSPCACIAVPSAENLDSPATTTACACAPLVATVPRVSATSVP